MELLVIVPSRVHFSEEKAESLNAEFIRRNLSPGGAADTLALTLFLEKITCNRLL